MRRFPIFAAIWAGLALSACDFNRPAGQSAWSAWVPPPRSERAAPEIASAAVSDAPAAARPASDTGRPPTVIAVEPDPPAGAAITVAPPPGSGLSVAAAADPSRALVRIEPAPVAAARTDAAPVVLLPAGPLQVRLIGRLYRTFGELGSIDVDDGALLTRRETTGAAAYCADRGQVAADVRGAEALCFYDRNGDGLLDTLYLIGRPDIGFLRTGPFPFKAAGTDVAG